jgi:hypothetical protein
LRIIVAGGRKFDNYELLKNKLDEFLQDKDLSDVEIVSGRAIGTDRLGERYAEEKGLKCAKFEAEWFKLGKRAGMVRNGEMAKYASETQNGTLFAFWNGESKGTKNMIDQATRKNLNIHIIRYDLEDNNVN